MHKYAYIYLKASPLPPAPCLLKTAGSHDNKLQDAGLLAQCHNLLPDDDKIAPWASVWHHLGGPWEPWGSLFQCFGDLLLDLGGHCAHIGCQWPILGSWVVIFGAFGLLLGRPWHLLGSILRSFGVILGASGT